MLSAIRGRGKTAHEALLDIWESEYENEIEERFGDINGVETNTNETNRDLLLMYGNDHNRSSNETNNAAQNAQAFPDQPVWSDAKSRKQNDQSSNENWIAASNNNKTTSSTGFGCPVCLEPFAELTKKKNELYSTVCGHLFCRDCIMMSLKIKKRCPSCRKKINAKEVHPIYFSFY